MVWLLLQSGLDAFSVTVGVLLKGRDSSSNSMARPSHKKSPLSRSLSTWLASVMVVTTVIGQGYAIAHLLFERLLPTPS